MLGSAFLYSGLVLTFAGFLMLFRERTRRGGLTAIVELNVPQQEVGRMRPGVDVHAMLFPMRGELFADGEAVGWKRKLSPIDQQFVAALYPLRPIVVP